MYTFFLNLKCVDTVFMKILKWFRTIRKCDERILHNSSSIVAALLKLIYYPKIFWQIEFWIHPTIRFQGLFTHSTLRLKIEIDFLNTICFDNRFALDKVSCIQWLDSCKIFRRGKILFMTSRSFSMNVCFICTIFVWKFFLYMVKSCAFLWAKLFNLLLLPMSHSRRYQFNFFSMIQYSPDPKKYILTLKL